MGTSLHITNGDATVSLMREGGIEGDILPWRDVLHDGPVPECADIASLSAIRARFIGSRGWADTEECLRSFNERDAMLAAFPDYGQVCLWFEHDLYDQLQILQVLDFLHRSEADQRHVKIICIDRYLGLMKANEITELAPLARTITPAQYALASMAWQAFCSSSPERWNALQERDLSPLPFLKGAVVRCLEEYPSLGQGLTRTERQALTPLYSAMRSPGELFRENQKSEERIFMGDSSFWVILDELMADSHPLLRFEHGKEKINRENLQQPMCLTEEGKGVLNGKLNRMDLHFPERWIGGVRIDQHTQWRWDADKGRIHCL
ncbi:MAG: DUF1835 domain-containing protein [Acidiferrobacterales bacterium]|nr:DUF1835 domain-containing protein [Acidiferrobacterales bacterium]